MMRPLLVLATGAMAAALVWLPVVDVEGPNPADGTVSGFAPHTAIAAATGNLAERPIFSPSRRPFVAARALASDPSLRSSVGGVPALRGVIKLTNATIVVFETPSNGRVYRVEVGKAAAGWEVGSVGKDGVVTIRDVATREAKTLRMAKY